jgi:RsiW-degrading membrane proteinase PrsW (M82 family)
MLLGCFFLLWFFWDCMLGHVEMRLFVSLTLFSLLVLLKKKEHMSVMLFYEEEKTEVIQ